MRIIIIKKKNLLIFAPRIKIDFPRIAKFNLLNHANCGKPERVARPSFT